LVDRLRAQHPLAVQRCPDGLRVAAGQPARRAELTQHQWRVEGISTSSGGSCAVPGLAWWATMRQPWAVFRYTLVAITQPVRAPSGVLRSTRSTTLCSEALRACTRRTFSAWTFTGPLEN